MGGTHHPGNQERGGEAFLPAFVYPEIKNNIWIIKSKESMLIYYTMVVRVVTFCQDVAETQHYYLRYTAREIKCLFITLQSARVNTP